MSANELPEDSPAPRLCHLVKWTDFDGYGFNLHAEKTKVGQYIGKVDEGSPAEAAGLKTGDRIVEVNDVNISNENHRQVVERIKAIPNETKLLVVDEETDKWHKQHKLVVKGKQDNVKYIKAPATKQEYQKGVTVNGVEERRASKEPEEPKENGKITENKITENSIKPCENGKANGSPKSDRKDSFHSDKDDDERQSSPSRSLKSDEIIPSPKSSPKETDSVKERPKSAVESTSSNSSTSGGSRPSSVNGTPPPATRPVSQNDSSNLNLNMTASEMRALLASRKKYDPKKENIDLRKKYAIIQEM